MMSIISNSELDAKLVSVLGSSVLYSHEIKIVAEMQYLTGCRANDLLEFNRWSMLLSGQLQLQPQKGNDIRLFDYSEVNDDWYYSVASNSSLLNSLNYRKYNYYVDRALSKWNFHVMSKNISTHVFRHNYAKKLHDNGMSDLDVKVKLGERRLTSAQGYINSIIYWYS